jgi:hypothetical protein
MKSCAILATGGPASGQSGCPRTRRALRDLRRINVRLFERILRGRPSSFVFREHLLTEKDSLDGLVKFAQLVRGHEGADGPRSRFFKFPHVRVGRVRS